jgi:hypothetical protein
LEQHPRYGNALNVFRDAGLAYDRKAYARIVGRRRWFG